MSRWHSGLLWFYERKTTNTARASLEQGRDGGNKKLDDGARFLDLFTPF
jgi:hypothetical protein